jgi:hypothetical protein
MGQIRRVKISRPLEPVGICLFYRFDQTLDPVMRQLEQLVRQHMGLPSRRGLAAATKPTKKSPRR